MSLYLVSSGEMIFSKVNECCASTETDEIKEKRGRARTRSPVVERSLVLRGKGVYAPCQILFHTAGKMLASEEYVVTVIYFGQIIV